VGDEATEKVERYLGASRDVLATAMADEKFVSATTQIASLIEDCLRADGKVLLAGNGGSAGDAQHIAGEMVSRLNFDRDPLAGIALTTDTSILTAIGNDYGYEQVFSRQIRGIGRRGDVFVAISTSGKSPNILAAVQAARHMGIHTVGFTGKAECPLSSACDLVLRVPSISTPLIQQVYMVAAHSICELVEDAIFGDKRAAKPD
jgi:D-sedoheptulose 7-phosphate isomerase